jgi:hypothetical protein
MAHDEVAEPKLTLRNIHRALMVLEVDGEIESSRL